MKRIILLSFILLFVTSCYDSNKIDNFRKNIVKIHEKICIEPFEKDLSSKEISDLVSYYNILCDY